MEYTLLEAAKLSTDILQRGVIETYAKSSPILEMMPFMSIEGNSYRYNQEGTLPGIGFRSVNQGYTPSAGIVNQLSENLSIAGGDVDVDRFITQTLGNVNDQRAIQTHLKVKAMSLAMTRQFFKGDSTKEVNGFDGLDKRLKGSQVLDAKGEITIMALDELIDSVEGEPDVIFVSKSLRREIKRVIQGHNGFSESSTDAFGRRVLSYGGIQIRTIETDGLGQEILPFSADTPGEAYAVRFGIQNYVSGLQNGSVSVRDLGELESKPSFRTRIEWYTGMAVFHPKAAAVLKGIVSPNATPTPAAMKLK